MISYKSQQNEATEEISNIRKSGMFTNMWKLNNTFLKGQEDKEDIKREIGKHIEMYQNESITHQTI